MNKFLTSQTRLEPLKRHSNVRDDKVRNRIKARLLGDDYFLGRFVLG